jgi:hypothetical protein
MNLVESAQFQNLIQDNEVFQARQLVAENGWLREELSNTQTKLCDSEMHATNAEEECAHYKLLCSK